MPIYFITFLEAVSRRVFLNLKMPLAFKVECKPEFNELMKGLRTFPTLQNHIREHKNSLSYGMSHSPISRVYTWLNLPLDRPWMPRYDFVPPVECDLVFHKDRLVESMKLNKVVIIEAETGSGKSIIAPSIAYMAYDQFIREDYSNNSVRRRPGFRGIHLTPTGEQAIQNAEYIETKMMEACGMVVGFNCTSLNRSGENKSNIINRSTNYLYCTQFYGVHALVTDCHFHVVVLDDVHELTPNVLYLLYLIRERLKEGRIFRVLLLTSSMPFWLKRRIVTYFNKIEVNVGVVACGTSPHPVHVMEAGNDKQSHLALVKSERNRMYTDNDLLKSEGSHTPNVPQMRTRCLEFSVALSERFFNIRSSTPASPGCLVFLPGAADTVLVSDEMKKRIRLLGGDYNLIDVQTINGEERSDLTVLTREDDGHSIRNVFSTPSLSTGVTVLGIDNVLDSGLVKIRGTQNLRGILQFHTVWIDKYMRKQRMGRVGRLRPGYYMQCYSNERARLIEDTDWTKTVLMSKFTTADLAPLLNYYNDFLIVPDQDVFNCLLLEAGLQGFFKINLESESDIRVPRMDILGETIFHSFPGLSLDCGLFLMNCASFGCLLSGMIYVASHQCRHAAIKKPSGAHKGRFGRDSPDLLMNKWPRFFELKGSDMQIYCEIVLNVWMCYAGHKIEPNPFAGRVRLPYFVNRGVNVDGVWEVHRALCGLANGLIASGIISEMSDIFQSGLSALKLDVHNGHQLIRLESPQLFSVAITSSFGSRVLSQSEQQRGYEHTTFTIAKSTRPGSECDVHLQGERAHIADSDQIAVYHNIYKKDNNETFLTALIHQCSPLEFLIFGNSYGSYNDKVDIGKKTLTINTCTGSVYFEFQSAAVLDHICWFRKLMKLQPTIRFYSNLFKYHLSILATIDFSKYLSVSKYEPNLSVQSIDKWEDCAGVGLF